MADVELQFICLYCPSPAPPILLLFLLRYSCHPLKKSANLCNLSGDRERKTNFFSAVF